MTDVIQLIEHDHREVESMFEKFRTTRDRSVLEKICEELERHADAEEKVAYPAFREVPTAKKLVKEGEEEHGEARQLIGRIKRTEDPEHLTELATELEQAINHHVQEEEREMLPTVRQGCDSGYLDELGRRFEERKQTANI